VEKIKKEYYVNCKNVLRKLNKQRHLVSVELIDFDTEKTNLTQNGAKKFGQHYY
jgi:hypothetical protein